MEDCIFCKIGRGEIPCKKVYEDDDLIAFHDINPISKVHILLVPKLHIESLFECTSQYQELLGRLLLMAPKLALEQGLTKGFRTMINTGKGGGQEVFHLHVHVFGGAAILEKT